MEPSLLDMFEVLMRAGSARMKHLGPDWQLGKITCVGGHMLPCVYNAWDTNSYPVFPRLQDVIAGQHPDVEERIRQAFAVGEDLGYRMPSPSPDGKQHFPAWELLPPANV